MHILQVLLSFLSLKTLQLFLRIFLCYCKLARWDHRSCPSNRNITQTLLNIIILNPWLQISVQDTSPNKPEFLFSFRKVKMKVALCHPMDYTVRWILQCRILEWVAIPFSRGSSQPRDRTQVSHIVGKIFTSLATREALVLLGKRQKNITYHLEISSNKSKIMTICWWSVLPPWEESFFNKANTEGKRTWRQRQTARDTLMIVLDLDSGLTLKSLTA